MKVFGRLLFLMLIGCLCYLSITAKAVDKGDKEKYILSIDQRSILMPKDTIAYGKKYRFTKARLKLSNITNDTLKYWNMSCEWWAIYNFNNKNMSILWEDCLKNIPRVFNVPPHTNKVITVPIIIAGTKSIHHQKFKIGMSLHKYIGTRQNFITMGDSLRQEKNLIWSNEVEIP